GASSVVKSTVENVGPTRVKLAVEVPFDELKPSLDAAYKAIAKQVRIPGFRPGKAPARIIDQRVGRAAVLEQAVNDALPRVYSEAVRESGVRALGQPEIEVTNLDDGQSLSFTAEVDVRPEITLPELKGIEVSVDDVAVTDAEVEEQLDALRERFASLTGVDRPAQTGDFVSLDLSAGVDGEGGECGSRKGRSYGRGRGGGGGEGGVVWGGQGGGDGRAGRRHYRQIGGRHGDIHHDIAPGRSCRGAGRHHGDRQLGKAEGTARG